MGPRLIGRDDEDVSDAVREILEAEGIEVRLNAECIGFRREGDRIAAGVSCEEGPPEAVGSHLLLAVGRVPNTHDLGLENAGITPDDRGFIPVDDQLRTEVPGIWAVGDCNRRGAFTHTSYHDTRSSPPTSSTAIRAGSRTASCATASTSTRRARRRAARRAAPRPSGSQSLPGWRRRRRAGGRNAPTTGGSRWRRRSAGR